MQRPSSCHVSVCVCVCCGAGVCADCASCQVVTRSVCPSLFILLTFLGSPFGIKLTDQLIINHLYDV